MTDSMDTDTERPGTSGTGRQSCLISDLAMILDSSSDDESQKTPAINNPDVRIRIRIRGCEPLKIRIRIRIRGSIHEIAHNLAFGHGRPLHNRLLGFFANLPLGIPLSISFKKYHLEHHRYQGDEVLDIDLPTLIEARMFCTTGGKLLWLALQPLMLVMRPLLVRPQPATPLEVVNLVIQLLFDAVIVKLFGNFYKSGFVKHNSAFHVLGWTALAYLVLGTLMSTGLHPIADGQGRLCRPKSYPPIGLLPVLGKTVERMLVGRLQWHIMPKL
ncbi:Sphingolipid delta(4)-desaturase DES1 [Eumeta japonica]|uniref:Sphingolipid delta(4)-desaturase DES1 n=1 Tax=Eumeta variegata TaxID=151549 RepID=A0A4C1UG30_EUMVA|nr:Sphingolipid delta(4)-desaturase DES1 [Eumeta japonica]